MVKDGKMLLRDLLLEASELPWNYSLYLPFDQAWLLSTPCAILDPDTCGESGLPDRARELGFEYALGMQQIHAVIRNAQSQRREIAPSDLLAALLYYYDNDAYIDFERSRPTSS